MCEMSCSCIEVWWLLRWSYKNLFYFERIASCAPKILKSLSCSTLIYMSSMCLIKVKGHSDRQNRVKSHTEKTIYMCVRASRHLCLRTCLQPLCRAVQKFELGSDTMATTPLWGANPVLSWGISEMP